MIVGRTIPRGPGGPAYAVKTPATAIPAITLWQPWASLVAAGCKPNEFRRSVPPKAYRNQRIAIHAAARTIRKDEIKELLLKVTTQAGFGLSLNAELALPLLERWLHAYRDLPTMGVLCTAMLGEPVRATTLVPPSSLHLVDARVWAWPLSDIQAVAPFVRWPGEQGWWKWQPPKPAPDHSAAFGNMVAAFEAAHPEIDDAV